MTWDAALQIANQTRTANAEVLKHLKTLPRRHAHQAAAAILTNPNQHTGALRLAQLLRAIPFVGHHRARQLLLTCRIYGNDRRVRDLTPRQAHQLADLLLAWSPRTERTTRQ